MDFFCGTTAEDLITKPGINRLFTWINVLNQPSPCNNRGFLFLQSPSSSPKSHPIPGTIDAAEEMAAG